MDREQIMALVEDRDHWKGRSDVWMQRAFTMLFLALFIAFLRLWEILQ